jgi:hypothetical protein
MRSTAPIWFSRCCRSRITFWARSGELHRSGSSEAAFSSSRRRLAVSQSKMPPQQGDRLLDFIDDGLDLGAHSFSVLLVFGLTI